MLLYTKPVLEWPVLLHCMFIGVAEISRKNSLIAAQPGNEQTGWLLSQGQAVGRWVWRQRTLLIGYPGSDQVPEFSRRGSHELQVRIASALGKRVVSKFQQGYLAKDSLRLGFFQN